MIISHGIVIQHSPTFLSFFFALVFVFYSFHYFFQITFLFMQKYDFITQNCTLPNQGSYGSFTKLPYPRIQHLPRSPQFMIFIRYFSYWWSLHSSVSQWCFIRCSIRWSSISCPSNSASRSSLFFMSWTFPPVIFWKYNLFDASIVSKFNSR
jgi:hypothetical protein